MIIDRFFFAPVKPTAMALFRIMDGLILLQDLLFMRLPYFSWLYGDRPFVPFAKIETAFFGGLPFFDIMRLLPNTEAVHFALFVLTVASTVLMTAGFASRLSAGLTWVLLLSFNNHMPLVLNGQDVFLCFSILLLALSNAGDRFSLDSLGKRRREEEGRVSQRVESGERSQQRSFAPISLFSSPLAQRVLQLQVAFIYMAAVISKLQGADWLNGTAVYYVLRYEDMVNLGWPGFLDNLFAVRAATWGTIAVEAAICTLIWSKRCRPFVIASAIALHLSIDLAMSVPLFEWLFISSLILFLDDDDFERVRAVICRLVPRVVPGRPVAGRDEPLVEAARSRL